MASSLKSLSGVSNVKSKECPIASICLKIQLPFAFPIGAIAPFKIDNFLSGIILSMSISEMAPSPLHCGQAP